MKWDGKSYASVVKSALYAFFAEQIPQAFGMDNKEYADYLKSSHEYSKILRHDPNINGMVTIREVDIFATDSGVEIDFKRILNDENETSITLSWSAAARHIRSWEYEKKMTETPHAGQGALSDPKPMKFDKGMKHFFKDIGYVITHKIKPSKKLDKMIKDGDPKPLREFLKKEISNSGYCDGKIDYWGKLSQGVILKYRNMVLNNHGASELVVSWSQLATLLRDDKFRETYCFPTEQQPIKQEVKFKKGIEQFKQFYVYIGNVISDRVKPSKKLDDLIASADPNALQEEIRKQMGVSGHCNGVTYQSCIMKNFEGLNLIFSNEISNEVGTKELVVSWAQVAELLCDDDFRNTYCFPISPRESEESTKPPAQQESKLNLSKPKNLMQEQWDNTHLCGSKRDNTLCEFFLESEKDTVINGKKLDNWCYYCTAENKVRKIGSGGSWTGLSPTFCPKRKKNNAVKTEEDTQMTPNFNFKGFISEGNQLKQIPLDMLVPYHNHKFKLYEGERLTDMVSSIKENGVLTPIIVRNKGGEHYEILAGHNRANAARLAGLTVIPAIVKENLSDDEAEMYVIETNVMQRGFDDLSISERAAVIATRHSAMFDENKRKAIERELVILGGDTPTDEVEEEPDEKKSKLAMVGESYGLGKDSVARLIRIDKLETPLKPYVDSGAIPIRAAVNLSYLKVPEQQQVAKALDVGLSMDMKKSVLLREVSKQRLLTDVAINDIMLNGKLNSNEPVKRKPIKVKINSEISEKYFSPDWDDDKVREIVELALERYFNDTNHLIMDDKEEYPI